MIVIMSRFLPSRSCIIYQFSVRPLFTFMPVAYSVCDIIFMMFELWSYSDATAIWVWPQGKKQAQVHGADNVCSWWRYRSWNFGGLLHITHFSTASIYWWGWLVGLFYACYFLIHYGKYTSSISEPGTGILSAPFLEKYLVYKISNDKYCISSVQIISLYSGYQLIFRVNWYGNALRQILQGWKSSKYTNI